jgi:hypothetical protein
MAEIEGNNIKTLRLWGDFFASPEEAFETALSRLEGLPLDALAGSFDRFIQEAGIEVFGVSGHGLAEALLSVLETQKDKA